ncbi:MAG: MBL fold metallo-hydrolase [Clostridia bacterium]|nr:MBL fold metallo-hydrolase [Clostridia bacterium]
MKVTWLGQAGFLFENENIKIIVDPYLSDSCEKVNPRLFRRYPIDESFLKIEPDVIILTHSHLDHTDPDTLDFYLKDKKGVTVLASGNAWQKVRTYGPDHNYVLFNEGTEFTVKGITFKAVYAEHSDDCAIGAVFSDGDKTYYVTGDTLYNKKVFDSVTDDIDVLFLPINGVGNNMNIFDAYRFADKIDAERTVPCHFSLFDEIKAQDIIDRDDFVIPTPFKEIEL